MADNEILEKYGEFFYGTRFYGKDKLVPIPLPVSDFYVIYERVGYYILKWTAPEFNTDRTICKPTSYVIYRTEHFNKVNPETIAVVTDTDYVPYGQEPITTCFIDDTIDPSKTYFYQIVAINQYGESSRPTDWKTDIFLVKDTKYDNTGIYTSSKINYFYKLIEDIPNSKIFDKEQNIIPYRSIYKWNPETEKYDLPYCNYLILDFFPTIPEGTILSVYINDKEVGKNYNRKFFHLVTHFLPYSPNLKIEIRSQDGSIVYKTKYCKTYNYLIFFSALSPILNQSRVEVETVKNDIYKYECSHNKIYANFGSFFDLPKPKYLTDSQYRRLVVGDETIPGLFNAAFYGGTFKGIKDAVESITGNAPDIYTLKNEKGWILRKIGDPLITSKYILKKYPSDPVPPNCVPIKPFSGAYKAFTLKLHVYNGIKSVAREIVISSSYIDFLDGTDIVEFLNLVDENGEAYAAGIDFTIDYQKGTINWRDPSLPPGHKIPPEGTIYYVNYTFSLRKLIEKVVNLLKHPQYRFVYQSGDEGGGGG